MVELICIWTVPIRRPSALLSAGGTPPGESAAACVNSGVPTKAGAAGIGQSACEADGGAGSNVLHGEVLADAARAARHAERREVQVGAVEAQRDEEGPDSRRDGEGRVDR